ncbi:MAG: hypothetical protein J6A52_02575 [Bacilli bacterium]|nr:hypothetical protein [Bacilli bacterium]
MIKKIFSYVFVIVIIVLSMQLVINFLKTEHDVNYTLTVNDENVEINERYEKKGKLNHYFLNINYQNNNYFFEIDNHFNKQKEIVKKINVAEFDDYLCISIDYINDYSSTPICSKDGNLYSYLTLKDKYDFSSMIKNNPLKDKSDTSTYSDITINKDYLSDNEIILIYNYKEIVKIKNDDIKQLKFSSYDDYKNTYGALVGEYYIIPKNNNTPEYSAYITYNLTTDVIKDIEIPNKMSKQLYINGIHDNKLYLFDKSKLIQYEVDPYNNTMNIVGTTEKDGVLYKDGELTNISVYELNNSTVTFSEDISEYSSITYDKIFALDKYAIYIKGNNFYKVYKEQLDKPILLFSDSNFKEVKVKEDEIYYIKEDTLYKYTEYGIVDLIKREEFKYNSKNIFDVYIKED